MFRSRSGAAVPLAGLLDDAVARASALAAAKSPDLDPETVAALGAAIDAGQRSLFIEGDLALTGPAVFGSATVPVVIVVRGGVRFSGEVTVHGVVNGTSLQWNDGAAPGALVHGAALVAGDYSGNAAADFVRDDAVLRQHAHPVVDGLEGGLRACGVAVS